MFPKWKEVEGVGRSRECSSVGMTCLVAYSNSTTSTKNQVLQHLGQVQHPAFRHQKGELIKSRSDYMPEEETFATHCFILVSVACVKVSETEGAE